MGSSECREDELVDGHKRILASWVGHADLLVFAAEDDRRKSAVEAATGKTVSDGTIVAGPVRAALEAFGFDEVFLIADTDIRLLRRFAEWVGENVNVARVRVDDPTEYATVYGLAEGMLKNACGTANDSRELWLNLSSGTPAMAATLLLLGKTRYPSRFVQSFQGVAHEAVIPFDLTLEYLPELLREPDMLFQALAEKSPSDVEGFDDIVGNSAAIRIAVGRAKRAAIRDVSVLVLGESGVGKELFAHAIHAASPRRDGPFVPINCGAIPRELQESELFGHLKGSFTGAVGDRYGAFHQADGGTLFLDEFGELEPRTQASLLRALQPGPREGPCCRTFRRIGADADDSTDVRVIAATNQDPQDQIRDGRLREDLFYRIATITLRLPPLRNRRSDIPELTTVLLSRINGQFAIGEPGFVPKQLSGAAKSLIAQHDWPGNVRELSNVLVQAAVMSSGATIGKSDVAAAITEVPAIRHERIDDVPLGDGFDLMSYLDEIEKRFLERAREESGGVKTRAAELLGLKGYQTLDGKIKRLGIKWK